ncbi:hypothetical protein ABW21_db0207158 [Orbilia brochopaga]|nr:hypothetical protein ABW21_db0207158 [Drechslerella brochopaga]
MADSSGVTAESLEQTIREKLGATYVQVVDNSGGLAIWAFATYHATRMKYLAGRAYHYLHQSKAYRYRHRHITILASTCSIVDAMHAGSVHSFRPTIYTDYFIFYRSPQFEGKTSLAKSRLVNTTLKEEIAKIHAWSNKTYTPAQWEKIQTSEAAGA